MSIWSSLGPPYIDAYGEDDQPSGEPTGYVDVATSWNDCIRIVVAEPERNEGRTASVMLDEANAQRLVEYLQRALRQRRP